MKLPIGENIRALRVEQAITQDQLAEALGLTYQAISKWETGVTVPTVDSLPEIAAFFHVSIDDLFRPHMRAYRNRAERLLSLYEVSRTDEDYGKAEKAYTEMMTTGCTDPGDLLSYAILLDFRSQDYTNRAVDRYHIAIEAGRSEKGLPFYKGQRQLIGLLSRRSRIKESIDIHTCLLEKEPDDIQNHVSLAYAYHCAGKNEEAWSIIRNALTLAPDHALVLNLAGEVRRNQGFREEAIDFWKESFVRDPEMADNLFSLAFLAEEMGELDQAISYWRQCQAWLEQRGFQLEGDIPQKRLACLLVDNNM